MSSRDLVSRVDVRAWLQAALGLSVACVCSACLETSRVPMYEDGEPERVVQAQALTHGSCPSWRRSCRKPVCGNGAVESGEACDDGNQVGNDGCSASCQPDDDSRTPGDDRAGYVSCDSALSGHSMTCGPGFGCCPDPTNVPEGPVCGATRADCGFVMAFIVLCDGPEDCSAGTPCSVTRTGQICGSGYYGVCHKDSDCPDGQACDTNGECRAPASGP